MNRSIFTVCVIVFGLSACGGVQLRKSIAAVNPVEAVNKALTDHPGAIPVSCHRVHR